MKVSEILRTLADLVAKSEGGTAPVDVANQDQRADLHAVAIDNDGTGEGVLSPGSETMVPPLQQKLELLKKAAGVDSMYGSGSGSGSAEGCDDELDAIKRNAGLPVVVAHIAGEDNDVFQ